MKKHLRSVHLCKFAQSLVYFQLDQQLVILSRGHSIVIYPNTDHQLRAGKLWVSQTANSLSSPVNGSIADTGYGGKYTRPIHLLLGLPAVSWTLNNKLWVTDLPSPHITFYCWHNWKSRGNIRRTYILMANVSNMHITINIIIATLFWLLALSIWLCSTGSQEKCQEHTVDHIEHNTHANYTIILQSLKANNTVIRLLLEQCKNSKQQQNTLFFHLYCSKVELGNFCNFSYYFVLRTICKR